MMFYYFIGSFIIIETISFTIYMYKKYDYCYMVDLYTSIEKSDIVKTIYNIIYDRSEYNLHKVNNLTDELANLQYNRINNMIIKNPIQIFNSDIREQQCYNRLSQIDIVV